MPPTRPKRIAIHNHQRAALRAWFHTQRPKPTLIEAIAWYEKRYNHRLSKSTISESLQEKFAFLDKPAQVTNHDSIENPRDPTSLHQPQFLQKGQYRQRAAEWPEHEKIILAWYTTIHAQGGILTGDIIKEKAREIWKRIPSLQTEEPPKFSNGWLQKFKARNKLYKHTQHGEEGGVPAEADDEMLAIVSAARRYSEQDIFNMDETGLFWRMVPSTGLSSTRRAGIKKDKTRISIALCCNANGTERIPPLIIGRARVPHALRGVNVEAMGAVWRSNQKAWMTSPIMKEWLQSFYTYVNGRRVLLLLDNFSAHNLGLELAPPPENVEVLFLPKNATSRYQPLDQGIIQNFKVYYKKQWLQFMVKSWEESKEPLNEVSIRIALRWIIRAWDQDISATTIRNCYRRSTVIASPRDGAPAAIHIPDISQEYREALETGSIQDSMTLANFLNPEDETVDAIATDPLEAAFIEVLGASWDTEGSQGPQSSWEEEDILPTRPPPTLKEALECLERVTEYVETRPDGHVADLRQLARIERYLLYSYRTSMRQGTMDSWLKAA